MSTKTTLQHTSWLPAPDRASAERAARAELERFRHEINLVAFAATKGYAIDQRESSRSGCVMRHANGDKITIGRAQDGHWQYYSFRDERDNADIVNFVQHRGGGRAAYPLGVVRRELRGWTHSAPEVSMTAGNALRPVTVDREAVVGAVEKARVLERHPYLESRGLTRETLGSARFRGTWRIDASRHGNVIFPHHDQDGISGFEVKNRGFTGFSHGGNKGIWVSQALPNDERLVITESAIDALSYHQVNPHPKARYASLGGAPSRQQSELLEAAIARMTAGSVVVAATDNDKAGHAFAERIAELCSKHPSVTFERHAPAIARTGTTS